VSGTDTRKLQLRACSPSALHDCSDSHHPPYRRNLSSDGVGPGSMAQASPSVVNVQVASSADVGGFHAGSRVT
jgi:hypothetical protein